MVQPPPDLEPGLDEEHALAATMVVGRMHVSDLREALENLGLDTRGNKDKLKKRLRAGQKRGLQGSASDDGDGVLNEDDASGKTSAKTNRRKKEQPFDYYVVVDFEATCDERLPGQPKYPHEIIEFPAVLVDATTLETVDTFQCYVQPVLNRQLTAFCVNLTGITQDKVDTAPFFPQILEEFNKWLYVKHELGTEGRSFAFASDGPWDFRDFLHRQCVEHSKIPVPTTMTQWVDIRKYFRQFYATTGNVNGMLRHFGLEFEGREHSGLDDSINIARILTSMISDGCIFHKNAGKGVVQVTYPSAKRRKSKL